jgi:hypothetical protein
VLAGRWGRYFWRNFMYATSPARRPELNLDDADQLSTGSMQDDL